MNVIISGVTSQLEDPNSDDDVIEVVRDEAPIEILSDGEEMERCKYSENIDNDFNFASVLHGDDVSNSEKHTDEVLDDPLIPVPAVSHDGNTSNETIQKHIQAVPVSIITHTSAVEHNYKQDCIENALAVNNDLAKTDERDSVNQDHENINIEDKQEPDPNPEEDKCITNDEKNVAASEDSQDNKTFDTEPAE
ncbi:uncharacterized protein LOC125488696 [Plutella xylostella]|uniref:uncharacterized protein LOC125488696 n=1 Tax=Plutella xylostella TaxID=51655 RepID=UPI002032E63F|nr:uncharacterized protein LOC125488696 [Plutella xylostella]